ncbi:MULTISPECIES: methyltransferase [Alphaproteobacteria]|uniref:class I SAM-dependent methyltransferase n=1 Tax=Alphaproteobacteria TaxID=28211 RepID=UPI0027322431|nr:MULTISPECIES: methyltransferase [Alphaproteobacteria]MDP1626702.1 methyltransferase [Parvibaculum sp.]MDP2213867.1 methyltransferase [Phenylobacterium sp.]MDP3329156.1 methyltransferase [Parvibaculum sp.]
MTAGNVAARDPARFIRDNTLLHEPPLVPEVRLHLASEIVPIWQMTEEELEKTGLPPPFWAFAWAGGQALSRYILDNPGIVAGRRVLDFGSGSGMIGIAAMKAGAASVLAADIDRFAVSAIALNAAVNEVAVAVTAEDIVGVENRGWDVVLVGDMCYERPLAERVEAWLRRLAGEGVTVLIGDPGRTYLPKSGLEKLTSYAVMTTRELEDTDVRNTSVWRVLPL